MKKLLFVLFFVAVDLFAQTPTPTVPPCPPIMPTCLTNGPTQPPSTHTRTPTPGGPLATATRTRTRTPTPQGSQPTPTPAPSGSLCPVPCDQYALQYNYKGTWAPDVTGPFPPIFNFRWPRQQDWTGPGNYTMAYKVHTPLGGWSVGPQLLTFFVPGPDPAFTPWDEELYHEGITAGCASNPLAFCPMGTLTREQAAVWLLKTKNGSAFRPPPCTGIFADAPCITPTPAPTPVHF